jgi:ketosteroid isomerase-like protein
MNDNNNPMSDPKIDIIRRMYDAFGRGDVVAILADVADDVEWISVSDTASPSVPWYGRYDGKADVPRFFKEIVSAVDVTEFTPLSFTSNDTDVMVAIQWGFTVKATGKRTTLPMLHWWRFADAKVIFVRTSEDSAQSAAAFSPS